jgi:RNA polymerase sigma-70 factor (ECF subfamily)
MGSTIREYTTDLPLTNRAVPSVPLPNDNEPTDFMVAFLAHQRRIFGYIGSLLPNARDHEDVYQQTCLALWQKRAIYDPSRPFFAWACGFARNEVLKHASKSRKDTVCFSEKLLEELDAIASARTVDESAEEARRQALDRCLDALHERQRNLITRCYQGVETIKAVAAELAISPAALTMRLQRIRHALLKCVAEALAAH